MEINVNAQVVELINGIISHGDHDHDELSAVEFENMMNAYSKLEAWPDDGVVWKSKVNGEWVIDVVDSADYERFDFSVTDETEVAELVELYETLEEEIDDFNETDDFNVDFDGNEYRIISSSSIWDIYVEEIKNIVEDCYGLNLSNIPGFVAFNIDWEQTAKNAYADGYGHTFASYDGEESEAAGFYIFRIG